MRSSGWLLVGVAALAAGVTTLAACDKPQPQPPAATSVESAAGSSIAAPVAASASAATGASAAAPEVSPPDPGRVELTFTGDFEKKVNGEGALCDDGFWLRSNDVLGPRVVPRWELILRDDVLQLQVGPFESMQVFRSAQGSRAKLVRSGEVYQLDIELADTKKKGGKAHLKGTVSCGRPAAGKVPEAIAKILAEESASPVRDHCTQDFGREKTTACVSVVVPGEAEGSARELVSRLRKRLPAGWVAFVGTSRWLGDEQHNAAVEVVVGPGRDPFDILRLARSNAINYGMETESLVKKLRAYNAIVTIDIWHAETDTIELDLAELPKDLPAFTKDLYAFCPDIVDQGVGSVQALEREIAKTKRVFLWWD